MSEHDNRLRELGTQLPLDRPDPARRDAVRSALLVAAAEDHTRPAPRWYLVSGAFAAGALAAVAAVLLLMRGSARPDLPSAARIDASPSAQFDRRVTRTPTGIDEVVRVRTGSLRFTVGALRAGDHMRVATRDAEVEGEGRYDVVVANDLLQDVNVADGSATIRVTGQRAVFLSSGQSWHATTIISRADVSAQESAPVPVPVPAPAPVPVPDAVTAPVPVAVTAPHHTSHHAPRIEVTTPEPVAPVAELPAAPPPVATPAPTPIVEEPASPPGPSEVERRFQSGMALLKANKPDAAARDLLAAADADAGGVDPLAADARYFAAVALTKAGRKTEAERALVGFLDHAPTSIRRGRAAVMLARLVAERGDTASARSWFESALTDADPSVVAAARAGITALH